MQDLVERYHTLDSGDGSPILGVPMVQCRKQPTRHEPSVADCRLIDLPKIPDARGNLTFVEGDRHIPFPIQRVYWIYDVPGGERRGGHAYHRLQEFMIALSGSFDVVVDDGFERRRIQLSRSYYGLYVPRMVWRHLENFSTNSVCLILASLPYSEADYLYDRDQYLKLRGGEQLC